MAADRAALDALPDDALVPVRWVRELVGDPDRDPSEIGLTVAEVAQATDRATSTVRTWCAEGRLPGAYRLRGREWRVPASALAALRGGGPPPPTDRVDTPPGGLAAWRRAAQ